MSRRPSGGLVLPTLLSAAVIVGGLLHRSALRDAVTRATPAGMELELPSLYVLLSPVSRVLDTTGLLSIGQHVALAGTIIGLSMLMTGVRSRGRARRRAVGILTSGATALGTLLIVYASAVALPRPMARLEVSDPDLVRVDFHSHTNISSDARSGFSPEKNRAWHRAGGFDVAYVSDHRSFDGAEAGVSRNPARAGDGTVLLSAFEGRYLGTFEIFLSLTRRDSTTLMDGRRRLLEGTLLAGRRPASVVALPSPLIDVQAEGRDGPPYIAAIEISDPSPRGFAQSDQEHEAIIRRADSLGLALVAGTNNHGWGRLVAAWTVVVVRGWRGLAPDSLAARIEHELRASPRSAVRVVERRRPTFTAPAAMVFTVPLAAAQLFGTLAMAERLVWLIWIWGSWLLWRRVRAGSAARRKLPNQ